MTEKKNEIPVRIIKVDENDNIAKKAFVKFPIKLYKDCPYYVPSLILDELATLDSKKNPAFEMCEMQMFLAYKDSEIVGRLCAIINHKANEVWNAKNGRFGFVDFIDDTKVVDALFKEAEIWLKSKGMDAVVGPCGFSGLDHEGLLIYGFEHVSTMATTYSYPYYKDHIERLGFVKEVDANEYLIPIPEDVPERHKRIATMVAQRYGLKVLKFKGLKQVKPYIHKLFHLLNEAYKPLYGYTALSDKQIEYYVDKYVPILRWDLVTIIIEEKSDDVIGFGIGMPSLAKGLIKSRGKLFPTGWYHLLKDLKFKNPLAELLLIAISPRYQGKGVNAMIFSDFTPLAHKGGFKFAESNPELEVNDKVNTLWDVFNPELRKKRRFYKKIFEN